VNQPPTFENRLLAVLEAEVIRTAANSLGGQRQRRRRRARIGALAGAGVLAVAAAVTAPVLIGQHGSSAAWAVETRADGSVEVTIHQLRDPAGLERRLVEAGIPAYVGFVPAGMVCAQHTIRSDFSVPSKGLEFPDDDSVDTFIVHPGRLDPDERLALTGYADASGQTAAMHINVIPLTEERCQTVPMVYPSDSSPNPTVSPGR
jgi:hypothetical protein